MARCLCVFGKNHKILWYSQLRLHGQHTVEPLAETWFVAAHLVMSELMPLFERIRANTELAGVDHHSPLATIMVGHSPDGCLAFHTNSAVNCPPLICLLCGSVPYPACVCPDSSFPDVAATLNVSLRCLILE